MVQGYVGGCACPWEMHADVLKGDVSWCLQMAWGKKRLSNCSSKIKSVSVVCVNEWVVIERKVERQFGKMLAFGESGSTDVDHWHLLQEGPAGCREPPPAPWPQWPCSSWCCEVRVQSPATWPSVGLAPQGVQGGVRLHHGRAPLLPALRPPPSSTGIDS